MTSSAVTMELSISFVSWINDQLRQELVARQRAFQAARRTTRLRHFLFAGIACASLLLATLIAR